MQAFLNLRVDNFTIKCVNFTLKNAKNIFVLKNYLDHFSLILKLQKFINMVNPIE